MIRKFAAILGLLLLVRVATHAQDAPAGQQPAAPAQENPEDESTSRRKPRPHEYRNWTFNVGGGANLPAGTTQTFVKGGGGVAGAGVARNFSKKRSRSCGTVKSSSGPSGTMPVGFTLRWLP